MEKLDILILLVSHKHYFDIYFHLLEILKDKVEIEVAFLTKDYVPIDEVENICSLSNFKIISYNHLTDIQEVLTKIGTEKKGICITETIRNDFEKKILENYKINGRNTYVLPDGWVPGIPLKKKTSQNSVFLLKLLSIASSLFVRGMSFFQKYSRINQRTVFLGFDYVFSGGEKTTEILSKRYPYSAILDTGLSCFDDYTVIDRIPANRNILVVLNAHYLDGNVSKEYDTAFLEGIKSLAQALPHHSITIRLHPRLTDKDRFLELAFLYSNCTLEYPETSLKNSLLSNDGMGVNYKWTISYESTTFIELGLAGVHNFFFDPLGLFNLSIFVQDKIADYYTDINKIIEVIKNNQYKSKVKESVKCFENYCGKLDNKNAFRVAEEIIRIEKVGYVQASN